MKSERKKPDTRRQLKKQKPVNESVTYSIYLILVLLYLNSLTKSFVEVSGDGVHEFEGVQVLAARHAHRALNANCKVLSHLTVFNGLDDNTLEGLAPVLKGSVVVQVCTVEEATSPSKDRGNRVG